MLRSRELIGVPCNEQEYRAIIWLKNHQNSRTWPAVKITRVSFFYEKESFIWAHLDISAIQMGYSELVLYNMLLSWQRRDEILSFYFFAPLSLSKSQRTTRAAADAFMFAAMSRIYSYYIDTDEIPRFLLLLKNHIFTARSEDTIFIFHVWGYWCGHGYQHNYPIAVSKMNKKSCLLCGNFISIYIINRTLHGAWGYEFYLLVLKVSLTSERSERVRDTFSTGR